MDIIKRKFLYYELLFALLAAVLGTLLHFVYEWSNYNLLVSYFAPVNESTWEHLKLLFFPTLLLGIIEYLMFGKYYSNFITAKTIGLFAGLLFIVVFFYTYTGIIGTNFLWMDILTFLLSVLLCNGLSYYLIIYTKTGNHTTNILCICLLFVLTSIFILFTNHWPDINLFKAFPSEILKN